MGDIKLEPSLNSINLENSKNSIQVDGLNIETTYYFLSAGQSIPVYTEV